jgi:hypothetical protein
LRLQLKDLTRRKPLDQAGKPWKFVHLPKERGKKTAALLAQ